MTEGDDLINNFFLARQWAKHQTDYEISVHQIGVRPWAYYESGLNKYDNAFFSLDLLGSFSFREVVDRWTSEGLVLEAFGEGTLVRELIEYQVKQNRQMIRGGAAVTLADIRTNIQEKFDYTNNITLFEGDLYLGLMYGKILKLLTEQRFGGFKLIVCDPESGWSIGENELKPPIELVWVVLRRLYTLLDNGGELFICLPTSVSFSDKKINLFDSVSFWDRWITDCQNQNMDIKRGYGGTLRIVKNIDCKIPRFPTELL